MPKKRELAKWFEELKQAKLQRTGKTFPDGTRFQASYKDGIISYYECTVPLQVKKIYTEEWKPKTVTSAPPPIHPLSGGGPTLEPRRNIQPVILHSTKIPETVSKPQKHSEDKFPSYPDEVIQLVSKYKTDIRLWYDQFKSCVQGDTSDDWAGAGEMAFDARESCLRKKWIVDEYHLYSSKNNENPSKKNRSRDIIGKLLQVIIHSELKNRIQDLSLIPEDYSVKKLYALYKRV